MTDGDSAVKSEEREEKKAVEGAAAEAVAVEALVEDVSVRV